MALKGHLEGLSVRLKVLVRASHPSFEMELLKLEPGLSHSLFVALNCLCLASLQNQS